MLEDPVLGGGRGAGGGAAVALPAHALLAHRLLRGPQHLPPAVRLLLPRPLLGTRARPAYLLPLRRRLQEGPLPHAAQRQRPAALFGAGVPLPDAPPRPRGLCRGDALPRPRALPPAAAPRLLPPRDRRPPPGPP